MLKNDSENTAPEVLTDEQLDLAVGGLYAGPAWLIPGEPAPGQAPAHPGTYF